MKPKTTNRGVLYQPTDAQRKSVHAMSAYGIPQNDIARVIGITKNTLEKHFRDELDTAETEANAKVAQTLYQMATSGMNVAATIFWLKTRARWRETTHHAHSENINLNGVPTEDIERELAEIRGRADFVARASAVGEDVPDKSDGLLH